MFIRFNRSQAPERIGAHAGSNKFLSIEHDTVRKNS